MRADDVVVLTPFLHFHPGVVKRQETVSVEALGSELAVERLDECIIRWLSRAGKVELNAPLIGPQVQIAGDELGTLIHSYRIRITN